MPYIKDELRAHVDLAIKAVISNLPCCGEENLEGALNYCISRVLAQAFELDSEPRYHKINRAIGTLECVKQELYRRLAGPYEDRAIEKNGDIPEYSNLGV